MSEIRAHEYLTYKLDVIKTIAVDAASERYAQATGLRVRELRLLRLIHDYPDITASEIKKRLILEKTLVSKHLSALEAQGYIQKSADPKDNRLHRLSLTAAGLAVWQRCEKIGSELERQMFNELTAAEWQTLNQLLNKSLLSLKQWQDNNQLK